MRTRNELVQPVIDHVDTYVKKLAEEVSGEYRKHHSTYARGLIAALYLQSLISREEYTRSCDAIDAAFKGSE